MTSLFVNLPLRRPTSWPWQVDNVRSESGAEGGRKTRRKRPATRWPREGNASVALSICLMRRTWRVEILWRGGGTHGKMGRLGPFGVING